MILPDDNYSVRGARGRFDPRVWLSDLADHPDDVAHAVELARLHGDEAVEALLAGVACGPRYPVRASGSSLRWVLPRVFRRPRPVTVLDVRFATHLAAVLGLAAQSDGPTARRIRGLRELVLPQRAPWWLHDSLEGFGHLTHVTTNAPWHPAATLPQRFFCLPSVEELHLHGAGLGDHRFATAEWHLPSLTRLSLSGNGLTRVPEQVLGLANVEVLFLHDNPHLRELPAALADLPRLRHVDARRTDITTLPPRVKNRPGLHVQLDG